MLGTPLAGAVDYPLWLPPLAALAVSFFSSMVGISGAFLLMPFQISVLGHAGPAASATNLLYNLIATPGGAWRYDRDGRLAWPLAWVMVLGTLPGVVAGFYLRVLYLPDPSRFKPFVGTVLVLLAWRLLWELAPWRRRDPRPLTADSPLRLLRADAYRIEFRLGEERVGVATPALLALALAVGVVGGTYGIGGGAIMAPFCIAVFRLPIVLVAGAALAATFATSVFGVLVYSLLPVPGGGHAAPDWVLGSLFGLGGIAGMYLGAATQARVPQRWLRLGLGLLLAGLGVAYLWS